MKYLNPDGFSVALGTKEYRDNYDTMDWGPDEPAIDKKGELRYDAPPPIDPGTLAYLEYLRVASMPWEERCATFGDPVAKKRLRVLDARAEGWRKHLADQGSTDALPEPPDKFTCDECPQALPCPFAFDDYNTGGDCLAEK